ncbi:DUF222 domain-containing protein [Kribbella deserti]|uniref:DUF222 domain-containing protein n=1 Tax=Kribbella deserti TaxID=1926257 RepID=A0ABV6QCU1_9ACTN
MFDPIADEFDVDQTLDRGAAARAAENAAQVELILVALHYADLNAVVQPPPGGEIVPGIERLRVFGGEGCPPLAEFCAMEFGGRLGMSHGAAAAYLGEALALRHRFPKTFAQVLAGKAEPWRARQVARACLSLSLVAAGIVDDRVSGIINKVTPARLGRIVAAAKMQADPEKAKADAELFARQRGVWLGRANEHGTKSVIARTAAGDANRLDAAVEELAEILALCGDTDSHQQRRAKALGLLADPAAALELRSHGRRKAARSTSSAAGPASPVRPVDPGDTKLNAPAEAIAEASTDANANVSASASASASACATVDASARADGDTSADGGACADANVSRGGRPDADLSASRHVGADPQLAARGQSKELEDDLHEDGVDEDSEDSEDGVDEDVSLDRLLADIKYRSARRAPHTVYVHITDTALAAGEGVARVEGIGPMLVSQLKELIAHEHVVLKPVIDLREQISVDAYEAPQRIREWIKLRYPTPMVPWATTETTLSTDLDHVRPFTKNGPPGQTSTTNLSPVTRLPHNAKTHGGWRNTLLPDGSIEWISPRGARYLVDHTGTQYLGQVDLATGVFTASRPPPSVTLRLAEGS